MRNLLPPCALSAPMALLLGLGASLEAGTDPALLLQKLAAKAQGATSFQLRVHGRLQSPSGRSIEDFDTSIWLDRTQLQSGSLQGRIQTQLSLPLAEGMKQLAATIVLKDKVAYTSTKIPMGPMGERPLHLAIHLPESQEKLGSVSLKDLGFLGAGATPSAKPALPLAAIRKHLAKAQKDGTQIRLAKGWLEVQRPNRGKKVGELVSLWVGQGDLPSRLKIERSGSKVADLDLDWKLGAQPDLSLPVPAASFQQVSAQGLMQMASSFGLSMPGGLGSSPKTLKTRRPPMGPGGSIPLPNLPTGLGGDSGALSMPNIDPAKMMKGVASAMQSLKTMVGQLAGPEGADPSASVDVKDLQKGLGQAKEMFGGLQDLTRQIQANPTFQDLMQKMRSGMPSAAKRKARRAKKKARKALEEANQAEKQAGLVSPGAPIAEAENSESPALGSALEDIEKKIQALKENPQLKNKMKDFGAYLKSLGESLQNQAPAAKKDP